MTCHEDSSYALQFISKAAYVSPLW